MDINRFNFWHTLPAVLEAISLSEYVAFDLEMTGVSGHSASKTQEQTETAAYHLAVDAATTFQVLQIGLTCLCYDSKQNGFRARTFTFHITPEFVPPNAALAKLIDRKLVLSYRSFLFLKENNFSFEEAFLQGVPYLSRPEGVLARKLYLSKGRHHNSGAADTGSTDFCCHTRVQILAWLETNPESGASIFITSPCGLSEQLGSTHVRAIRQLVQTEFPSCFAVFRKGNVFAEVIKVTRRVREEGQVSESTFDPWACPNPVELSEAEYQRRHTAVVRQTGFRYVIEALVGGSFAKVIDLELLVDNRIQGADKTARMAQVRSRLILYEDRIKKRRPAIIGHNPFLDLCFIQETFLQPLPADAVTFSKEIHQLFPKIIDTKYLASHLGFRAGKNLEQLYKAASEAPLLITPEPGFDARDGSAHNAGFDSWMTAAVFVSLARKMVLRNPGLCTPLERGKEEGADKEEKAPGLGAELFRELSPFACNSRSSSGLEACAGELILQWGCEVWKRYGNKLRLGYAGVMDLAKA